MNTRSMLRRVMLGAALGCSVGGCSLGLYLDEQRAAVLLAEIEALAADKSSTSDADCGVVAVGAKACGGPETYVVYSRAAADEELLLDKVREYTELQEYMNDQYHLVSTCDIVLVPFGARSENGVCVAGSR